MKTVLILMLCLWVGAPLNGYGQPESEIQSQEHADWGNFVRVRYEVVSGGLDRHMTVYNSSDGKVHHWISSWRTVDEQTFRSQAREYDSEGNLLQEWPAATYRRIEAIPDSGISSVNAQSPEISSEIIATDRYEFYSNFWMNLHHYLYTLAQEPGSSGWRAVAGEEMLAGMDVEEISVLERAVQYYREHLSERDLLFDDRMYRVKRALIEFEMADTVEHDAVDSEHATVLNTAARPYREHVWETHDGHNRRVVGEHLPLIRKIENSVFDRIAALAQQPWPERKVRVDISYYSNWAGGYTTVLPTHAVITSQTEKPERGWPDTEWLELVFHEPTHEIILPNRYTVGDTIEEVAGQMDVETPDGLWHAMLFYFSGRTVQDMLRSEGVEHELVMITGDIFSRYHPVVFEHMPAYFEGKESLENAVRKAVLDLNN